MLVPCDVQTAEEIKNMEYSFSDPIISLLPALFPLRIARLGGSRSPPAAG